MDLPKETKNLLSAEPVRRGKHPAGFYRALLFDLLLVSSSVATGYTVWRFLEGALPWWAPFSTACVFFVVALLDSFIPKSPRRRGVVAFLLATGFVVFFLHEKLELILLGWASLFTFFLMGEFFAIYEISNSLKIHFFRVVRVPAAKLATALVLSFVVFWIPYLETTTLERHPFIPRDTFNAAYDKLAGVLEKVYGNLPLRSSIGVLAKGVVEKRLAKSAEFLNLPQSEQQRAVSEAAQEFLKKLQTNLQLSFSANDLTRDVFYQYLSDAILLWQEKTGGSFLIGWAVFLFLLFRGVAVIVYTILVAISWIVFELLVASGFLHIHSTSKPKEEIAFA